MDPSHSVDDAHQSDDLVWATCRLDDGRQIRRTFTAAEADEFVRGEEDGFVNRLLNNRRATLLERVLSSDVTVSTDFLKSLNPFND